MKVQVQGNVPVPFYATQGSAGADICACIPQPVTIYVGQIAIIPTGLRIALPEGTVGMVYPRSGLAARNGVTMINSAGVIDSDYRGEIQCCMINLGSKPYTINDGDRIGQLIVMPYIKATFERVEALDETDRGDGGFGSTGL